MNTYIVAFELNSNQRANLESGIISISTDYCELHANAWLFKSDKDLTILSSAILGSVENSDRVYFSKVTAPYDAFLQAKAIDYIKIKKLV